MPIANIGSVPDVVTNTLIATDWGNAIGAASRGRVVQRFNSLAERDSSITAPITGMICYVLATDLFYGYRTATGWTVLIGGPRDTTHAKMARLAAGTMATASTVFAFDTATYDPLTMYRAGGAFVVPTAGLYLFSAMITAYSPTQPVGVFLALQKNAAALTQHNVYLGAGPGAFIGNFVTLPIRAAAGDTLTAAGWGTVALNLQPGELNCWAAIDYLGTG